MSELRADRSSLTISSDSMSMARWMPPKNLLLVQLAWLELIELDILGQLTYGAKPSVLAQPLGYITLQEPGPREYAAIILEHQPSSATKIIRSPKIARQWSRLPVL